MAHLQLTFTKVNTLCKVIERSGRNSRALGKGHITLEIGCQRNHPFERLVGDLVRLVNVHFEPVEYKTLTQKHTQHSSLSHSAPHGPA
jgi:hypothetical protein